ncbi:MAG: DNA polymerase IV [Bacilli bacterium]|nr:DNA polymerase IV [Bacilli bacterium]
MDRIVMHIDVNNAFLSWTALDLLEKGYKKDIRNVCAVIGGDEKSRHGIVLAKSTPAKKYGIVTAETLYQARKKCPNLEIYPSNYPYYQKKSKELFELISKYTPDIEQFSIDECFIEYTYVYNLYGDPIKFAYKIKEEIKNTLGFTVNIGIANNKLCAKMASDFEKPDKVHTLFSNEIEEKMYPLDVGDLLWIGKKSKEKLNELGIRTIKDLAESDYTNLYYYFKNQTKIMIEHAKGIDNEPVVVQREEAKGMSKTTTLDRDVNNRSELYDYLNSISNDLGVSLRSINKYASTVAVILKDQYFKTKTHQIKLSNPTNITSVIFDTSKKLLDETWQGEAIRLIGIRLDGLTSVGMYQYSLFEDVKTKEKDTELDSVMDKLKGKYGSKIINKASLLPKNKKM